MSSVLRGLSAVLLVYVSLAAVSVSRAETTQELEVALKEVREQIKEATTERDAYAGGAIRTLAEMRLAILENTRALLDQKLLAARTGAEFKFVLEVNKPNPQRAAEILVEIAAATKELRRLEAEAARFSGGLAQAMAHMSVITQKQTIAMLQQGYYANLYGLSVPHLAESKNTEQSPGKPAEGSVAAPPKSTSLDPKYPDMDHSNPLYAAAKEQGQSIYGRWILTEDKAEIDDSPRVIALAPESGTPTRFSNRSTLLAAYVEGETRAVVSTDKYFLSMDYRLQVEYRLGQEPAVTTSWSILSGNKGAGLFGKPAIVFLKELAKHDRMFVRLSGRDGDSIRATFDVRGIDHVIASVSEACGWLGAELSAAEIRAIQTLLRQAGFYTGAIDGAFGPGSRAAILKYQEFKKLPKTGTLNRATLESLGWKPN